MSLRWSGLLVIGLGWWLGSPLFLSKTVDEKPPGEMMEPGHPAPMMPDEMKPEVSGAFRDGDAKHHASGKAVVVHADEMTYLRLEELNVTNGPDLFVYLVKPDMPVSGGISLGKLKGNMGNQNYEIPPGTDLMTYTRVAIWCRTFDVIFGTADLNQEM